MLSSETSVLTRSTRLHITEDGIPNSHRRENLESDISVVALANQQEICSHERYLADAIFVLSFLRYRQK
jgi:hypothetical protein